MARRKAACVGNKRRDGGVHWQARPGSSADRAFARYLKTKNFHVIAERVRKIGGTTLHSIGQISQLQSIEDNDASFVPAHDCCAS